MSTEQETDPHPGGPQRFVGRSCSFDYNGKRLRGYCSAALYAGRTERGAIPDYTITIRGQTGATVTVSLVESRASFES